MNEKLKKLNIVQLVLVSTSILLNFLSLIISSLFFSWVVFVGIGLAIFAFMSNIANAFKKDILGLIYTSVSVASLIIGVIGIFNFISVAETFIGTMI